MAPRNGGGGGTPQTPQQQQETLPSNESPFPEREYNPFVSFRRLVDQQFESMFNAMIPASRYEDSPFWEQKEPQPSRDPKSQKHSRQIMNEEAEKMRQQWQDMENEMEREIARARTDAFKQLPWFWNTTTSNEKKPATDKQSGSNEHAQSQSLTSSKHSFKRDASTAHSPNTRVDASPVASPHVSSSSPGPDTEEQAYLFLNFPHARDQLRSLEREASSLTNDQVRSPENKPASLDRPHNEDSGPSSIFAPFMHRSSDAITRDDHNRERAETDELLNTLREALRGVEPWERARVTEQLPEAQQAREELRGRQCPSGRGHWNGFGEDWREARRAKMANAQRQRQEEQQKAEKSTPDRTVKAPWWWMGAIWDPTFPREADSYGMRRCGASSSQQDSTTASTSSSPAVVAEPRTSQKGERELQPGPRQWPRQTEDRGHVFTSSLTTTTSSTPQPDGSVLTRIVMEKRHPDGRDERNETVFTQRPGESALQLQQQNGADAWKLVGMGPATGRHERNTRMEEERESPRKEQDVGAGKREGKARKGWFWAS
ncbi:hypothetical protein EV356DRAFT_509083 [Viridothelium virens]|uniref:Uncharacterized protein n=1 Tax=Viridothelium virens TaxID=1048519 RepID=A0A6A6GYG9_VIRVR|nr:hypothetical protein EV356DRAFT_509083 [Viridothelium virens]